MYMKKLEKLSKEIGMQFEEAKELFGMETLESMQMVSIVGGLVDNGQCSCTNNGQCSCTTNGQCSCGNNEQCSCTNNAKCATSAS
jgi:hypothetical protein